MTLIKLRSGDHSALSSNHGFDVFFSHSTRRDIDRRGFVDDLARRLHQDGLTVFLDRLCVKAGEDLFRTLETAIRRSSVGILVMTKTALNKGWVALEIDEMAKRMMVRRMKVLGLRLEAGCEPPPSLPGIEVIEPQPRQALHQTAKHIEQVVRDFQAGR